jgi:uncharacterized membrane protein
MSFYDILILLYKYLLLFLSGTVAGWILEVFWRRYFGLARRWINPGFLSGPWLPLYGFGVMILYKICELDLAISVRAVVFLLGMTLLEYISGVIFTRAFKIRLWDYSESWMNIQGLICPMYSFLWMLLGLFFSLFIYPFLSGRIDFLNENLYLSFFLGIYGGVFSVDLWQSFNIASRIKIFVNESEERWQVDFELLKLELRDKVKTGFINRTHYLLPFYGELGHSLREQLGKHKLKRLSPSKVIRKAIDKRKGK